ncbi:hypothetical protein X757_32045 [Mesorhizobium sp. LSHC414A00]|nr:hypothetical protein X757_32045 [Mesorhizobium sp. LSHC414A00]
MGKSGFAGWLVGPAELVPHHMSDDFRAVIGDVDPSMPLPSRKSAILPPSVAARAGAVVTRARAVAVNALRS